MPIRPRLAGVQVLRLAELSGWEDLIDALLCAWTASLWARHGFDCC